MSTDGGPEPAEERPAPSASQHAEASGQAQVFQALGDQVIGGRDVHVHFERGVRRVATGAAPDGSDECPYPGLAAFRPEQAAWFFGRDGLVATLTGRLADNLYVHKPLVVVAPSGAGKSSLLQAGVLPAIKGGALPPAGSQRWPRIVFTPGSQPLNSLISQVAPLVGMSPSEAAGRGESGDRGRDACLAGLRQALQDEFTAVGSRIVVVVDQIEELFTECDDEDQRRAFLDELAWLTDPGAGQDPAGLVLLGLRADFYARCAEHPWLRTALQDSQVFIGPMSQDELRAAIVNPATAADLEVEPGLVDALLREVIGSPAGSAYGTGTGDYEAGRLPLLAHALRATWQQRHGWLLTLDGYRTTGGIEHAVATTAEQAFARLGQAGREAAGSLFLRMVKLGVGAEDTRRQVQRAGLIHSEADPEVAQSVIDEFTGARLLTQERDTVAITHEAMLHAWPRLRDWIEKDRAGNLIRQDLEDAAGDWNRAGREPSLLYRGNRLGAAVDWASLHPLHVSATTEAFLGSARRLERRVRTLRRSAVAGIVALALVATGTAVIAIRQEAHLRAAATAALNDQIIAEARQTAPTDPALSAQLTLEAYRVAPNQDNASRLVNLENVPVASRLSVSGLPLGSIAFSPAGHLLATGSGAGTVQLWDLTDPTRPAAVGPPLTGRATSIKSVKVSPDGHTLAAGSTNGTVSLWNITDPRHPKSLSPALALAGNLVNTVAFSPDSRTLAVGGTDRSNQAGRVGLWSLSNPDHPTSLGSLPAQSHGSVLTLAFSPDGRTLADGRDDHSVRLWNLGDPARTALPSRPHHVLTAAADALAFSPDGHTLATGGVDDGGIRLWDMSAAHTSGPKSTGKPLVDRPVGSVAFSGDGHTLAATHDDGSITLWNVSDPYLAILMGGPLTGGARADGSVAFSPDGQTLAAASNTGSVALWILPRMSVAGAGGPTAFSPDGRVLAAAGTTSTIDLWKVAGAHEASLLGHIHIDPGAAANTVAFSPDGHTLAIGANTAGGSGLWLTDVTDPRRPRPLSRPLTGAGTSVGSLAFSPAGHTLAVGSGDGTIGLLNVTDPRAPAPVGQPLTVPFGPGYTVAFTPDGHTLLAGGGDHAILSWNLTDPRAANRPGRPLAGLTNVTSMAMGPDGRILAVGRADGSLQLWNAADISAPALVGRSPARMSGSVESLVFSPDGHTLAAGGSDGAVQIVNVTDARAPTPWGHPLAGGDKDDAPTVVFSPDGHTLASSAVSVLRLWDLDVNHAVRRICSTSAGALTRQLWSRYVPRLAYRPPCSS
ncbi:WD40 repeat domain-containing protein [Streptomyces sp. NPDC090052]|uniref:WD40 repeat domain-containing protein n=1 Tax=Streptomyces sp. NPDC090052 TaxID=3365931 RepID=UPI003809CE00